MAVHVHHAIAKSDDDDENRRNPFEHMHEMFGPSHVDSAVRQAIQACWMALPKSRRNADEVEKEIRRLVDRALANLHEDVKSFGGDSAT
jgi:hypothetical protein